MKRIAFNRNQLLAAMLLLAAGLLIGRFTRPDNHAGHAHGPAESSQPDATEWTCSMHPQIRQPEPGDCPICGMDLIPVDDGASEGNPLEIRMSPTAMKLANIQTITVGKGRPEREIQLNGKIQPDERSVFTQVAHLDGRIEKLHVNFTGETVRKGQLLATLYAPALVAAQEELLAAAKMRTLQPALFNAAKEKLRNWKLTDSQIEEIITAGAPKTQFPLLADVTGVVLEKNANLGDYVMRGMPLYKIADLKKLWVLFDVYESDLAWIKVNNTVTFTAPSLPGETFSGRVAFIDPVINPATRVAQARVEIANRGGKLKPEMFVHGIVKSRIATSGNDIIVPKSAVLWTGERSVVYVKSPGETGMRFTMRRVEIGPLTADGYIIRDGLVSGEEVVVHGAFSIDAAAQLSGKPSMMDPEAGNSAAEKPSDTGVKTVSAGKQEKAAVQRIFDRYISLKDALVRGDWPQAQEHSAALTSTFNGIKMDLFHGPAHEAWMTYGETAVAELQKLATSTDLEAARKQFKPFSVKIIALVKAFGPLQAPVYVQFCPMADQNTGAEWLSLEPEIRNPYFGDKMLKCGELTATIK